MNTLVAVDILVALDRAALQATPAEIRARFGPDADLCEVMKFLTVLD